MSKESFYFSHDYEPTSDPKIQALLGEFGAEGYGVYWRIVEMLHSDETHKLPFKEYLFLAIAKQMKASVKQTEAIIRQCIDVFELFTSDDKFFWSNRVIRNFERRAELSEKRSIAGKAGAIAKQTQAKPNKGKEIKGKEIKRKEFIKPSVDDFIKYFTENGYTEDSAIRAFHHYDLADWHDAYGSPVLNWKSKVHTNWFKEENKIKVRKLIMP